MLVRRAAVAASHIAASSLAYTIGYRTGVHDSHDPRREHAEQAARDSALKTELLDHLAHASYVKLAPSGVAGVGVVAVVDIPPGTDPFIAPNTHLRGREWSVVLSADDLRRIPAAVAEHVLSFHDSQQDGRVGVNATAMVSMDASWYLNHGSDPNVEPHTDQDRVDEARREGRQAFNSYRTTRRVRAGEELLLDYRTALPSIYAQMTR